MGVIAAAQVDKKCYKNQTRGHLGVVKLDHLGGQVGANVEPLGTVWLSDDEALLTARAPSQAKDNPFVEWEFDFIDEKGQLVPGKMVPLVLLSDAEADRHTPSAERPVPGLTVDPGAAAVHADLNLHHAAAVQRNTEDALAEGTDRPTAPVAQPSPQRPQAGTAVAPPPLDEDEEGKESWTENPERTEEPQPGVLGGAEGVGPSNEDAGRDGSPTGVSALPAAPTSVASSSVEPTSVASQHGEPNASESSGTGEANGGAVEQGAEEHAGVTSTGEETGAAQTPAGEAPEGEFAQHEEVGSPDAPAQGAES